MPKLSNIIDAKKTKANACLYRASDLCFAAREGTGQRTQHLPTEDEGEAVLEMISGR